MPDSKASFHENMLFGNFSDGMQQAVFQAPPQEHFVGDSPDLPETLE